ncbi:RagB/SusD family nutrient uptake outer membrane protein [Adhaeribacter rhizoryzae]|uniref:RagB/SusD family nutrient uptake outer membrane protein n=1 Tax=Adhaeribacter rhizoryzae TaxID=2607907 RepID=A0A5M6D490_9BACT|nr:RagB/SusD family nutrient uptake outer membrane protein [Adhaeribacter rhizoryzae]KAA5540559.1 RagB/SusD family nutrient uptake outer membrane protein [Adhaeribacter rhizoryzae]
MKKNIFISAVLFFTAFLPACTDLDVDIESELTPANFPSTQDQFIAATGPLYSQLSSNYAINYWRLQELSTDAAIIPARAGNWDDGGQYRFLHKHTWNVDHPTVRAIWEWGFGGINTANRVLQIFEGAAESATRTESMAQVRTMRALYYYFMMDTFGNVPVIKTFGNTDLPATAPRAQVFAFIETELKESLPNLSEATGALTYGRPNKFVALALLTKLYLNAEYYIGKPMYTEAVAMADHILAANKYSLTADYYAMFAPDNGPGIQETIFAAVYDANVIKGNQFTRYAMHYALQQKYRIPFTPSSSLMTLPEYFNKFNLPNDIRNNQWLSGKQYNVDGTPVIIKTTNVGFDKDYKGPNPTAAVNWHLEIFPNLILENEASMDIGNDQLSQAYGVRSIKYAPDPNSATDRHQNNDIPIFRLADIMLMKAEAILRGATATTVGGELQTTVILVNKIRARVNAPLVTDIDLPGLLEERARELAWEGWRRNDLIRFGQFEKPYGFKTDSDPNKRIYPIPATERSLNPNLTQNPGY